MSPPGKTPRTGVLLVDKAKGLTSHDVVRVARRAYGQKEIGHTGTLDPMATGLLILTLGQATRLSRFLEAADKEYEGTVSLGIATSTYDADGEKVAEAPVPLLSLQDVGRVFQAFLGARRQEAPAFSAIKRDGEPLYVRARRGEAVEPPTREVFIHSLELLGLEGREIHFRTAVSKGTYIRSLAVELGAALGLPAHLSRLRRTRVGRHSVEEACSVDRLQEAPPPELGSPLEALDHLPRLSLDEAAAREVSFGRPLSVARLRGLRRGTQFEAGGPVLLDDGAEGLLAVGMPAFSTAELETWAGEPGTPAMRYACVLCGRS